MSLFRIDPGNPFDGPHQELPQAEHGASLSHAKAAMVMVQGIPLYNADVEAHGDPERVAEFKEAIRQADGLLIATPEYNHGVPAVTKNAIDWASRPAKKNAIERKARWDSRYVPRHDRLRARTKPTAAGL